MPTRLHALFVASFASFAFFGGGGGCGPDCRLSGPCGVTVTVSLEAEPDSILVEGTEVLCRYGSESNSDQASCQFFDFVGQVAETEAGYAHCACGILTIDIFDQHEAERVELTLGQGSEALSGFAVLDWVGGDHVGECGSCRSATGTFEPN